MEQNKLYKMMVGGMWVMGEVHKEDEGILGSPITIYNPLELLVMSGVDPSGRVGSMMIIKDISPAKSLLVIAFTMIELSGDEHEAYERHQAQKRTGLTLVGKG